MHLNEKLRAPSMKMCTGSTYFLSLFPTKALCLPIVSFNRVKAQEKQNYMNHTFLQSRDQLFTGLG